MIDRSEKMDALRFRYWTAMIQSQPKAIDAFSDYTNADEIRGTIDNWIVTLTVCNTVLKAIHPTE